MPTRAPDLDALLRSILRAEEEAPAPAVDMPAVLADPLLSGVIERALQPYERILSEKGLEHARRALALVFTTDPGAIAALAKLRAQGASGEVATGKAGTRPARRRQRGRP